jgi:lysophospholipase L1-like esterase
VIGSVCRAVEPKADHLEDVIRKRLAAEAGLPPAEVLNQGRDGEYVQGLLAGRYDKEIARLPGLDFVLIRYGINDSVRRQDFPRDFPADYRALVKRLRADHPRAVVVAETIIPYLGEQRDRTINDLIRGVAKAENLPLLDTHARYAAELKHGPDMLNYRRVPLDRVPARLRPLLPQPTAAVGGTVVALDNRYDAHMRDVPGWFGDRHPNLAGYHVIGDEAAKFLAPLIRERVRAGK